MSTITATRARQTLFPLIEQVNTDHQEVRITSRAGTAVLMSEADFEAWQTTIHLFSTHANTKRLLESIQQADMGHTETHELDRR